MIVLEYGDDLGEPDDWMPAYAEPLARPHAPTGPADAESLLALAGALSACP